jgi:methyltransferase family protein
MSTHSMPSADIVFDTLFAYQRSAALRTAIDLEVFTAIDEGVNTAGGIANRCGASERGTRILCDYLCVHGLLTKSDTGYAGRGQRIRKGRAEDDFDGSGAILA